MPNINDLEMATSVGPNDFYTVYQNGTVKKVPPLFAFNSVINNQAFPALVVIATPLILYRYQTVQLTPTPLINSASYYWSFGDGGASSQQTCNHKFYTPGVYNVSLLRTIGNLTETNTVRVTVLSDVTFAYTIGSLTEQLAVNNVNSLYSSGTVRNTNLWANYDWTCRGYNGNFTLITPNHAIYANHFGLPNPCQFVDNSGNIVSVSVAAQINIAGTDISVATFSTTVPNNIKPATLVPNEVLLHYYNAATEINIPIVILNSNGGQAVNTMMWIGDATFAVNATVANVFKDFPQSSNLQYLPVNGDSGSPAFFLTPHGPLLITSLFTAVSGPSYTYNRAAIEAITGPLPSPDLSSYTAIYP